MNNLTGTSQPEHLVSGLVFHENNKQVHFYPKNLDSASSRFPSNADYVSPDNWYIDCVNEKFEVHKPNGTVYTLDVLEHRNTGFFHTNPASGGNNVFDVGHKRVFVSKIRDVNNTTLNFTYNTVTTKAPVWRTISHGIATQYIDQIILRTITSNEGTSTTGDDRKVTLLYNTEVPGCDRHLISDVKYNKDATKDIAYSYTGCKLDRVTNADGSFWRYTYSDPLTGSAGNGFSWPTIDLNDAPNISGHRFFTLSTVTFPQGATVTYIYKGRSKKDYQKEHIEYSGPNDFIAALATRTVTGALLPSAMTWTFNYDRDLPENQSITHVDGPTVSGKQTRHVFKYGRSQIEKHPKDVPPVSGKLLEHSILDKPTSKTIRRTTYSWGFHGDVVDFTAHYSGLIDDQDRHALSTLAQSRGRRKESVTLVQDGETFVTQYNNFDQYGNARTVGELHPTASLVIDQGRTVTRTFYNNQSKWVIGKLETKSITEEGQVLSRTFDANANLSSETLNAIKTSYTYHSDGEVHQVKDGNNIVSRRYTNYLLGIARDIYKPGGAHKVITVNAKGQITAKTDWTGASASKVSYLHSDPLGRVSEVTPVHDAASIIRWPVWHNAANNQYRIKYTTQGANYRNKIFYDTLGRAVIEYEQEYSGNPDIVRVYRKYDAYGRVSFESLPTNENISIQNFMSGTGAHPIGIEYTYDNLGRVLIEKHTADNSSTHYCYGDVCGSSVPGVKHGVGAVDNEGYYSIVNYRAYGHPGNKEIIQTLQQNGSSNTARVQTDIHRNRRGFITKVTQEGLDKLYTYKPGMALLATAQHPETGTTKYENYDNAGNLLQMRDADNVVHVYSYDTNNRLTKVNHKSPAEDVTYNYNKNDQVTRISSGSVILDYVFRTDGSLDHETLGLGGQSFKLDYGYNNYGFVNNITYPSGLNVNRHVDSLGRLRSVADFATDLTYYANGQIKNTELSNDQRFIATQSAKQLPRTWKTLNSDNTAMHLKYDYDTRTNVSKITDYVLPANTVKNMKYDGMGRLSEAYGKWGAGVIAYNDKGNITSMKLGGETLTYNYNYTYSHGRTNLLYKVDSNTGLNNYTFDYDRRGNVTDNDRVSFAYDYASRLLHADANGRVYDFLYDGNGKRVRSFHRDTDANNNPINTTNVTEYFFYNSDGNLLFEKNDTTGQIKEYIFANGKAISYVSTHSDTYDTDGDGIPDYYEELYGLAVDNAANALSDPDNDGLTNLQEFGLGANPNSVDTDNDGMSDGDEAQYQLDIVHNDSALDADGDGATNYNELIAGTNPSDHLGDAAAQAIMPVICIIFSD